MKHLALAVATLLVLLPACGEEDAYDVLTRDGHGTGIPGFHGTSRDDLSSIRDIAEGTLRVKLTDDMMERYVAMMTEAAGVDTPSEALLARHKFDWAQWSALNAIVWTSTSRVALGAGRDRIEQGLADARKRLAAAGADAERETLRSMITAYEKQSHNMGKMPGASDVDRHNVEILKRWEPRLKALRKNR